MQKYFFKGLLSLLLIGLPLLYNSTPLYSSVEHSSVETYAHETFLSFEDNRGMSEKVFTYAYIGYLNAINRDEISPDNSILTVIDFSLPSTAKRIWVLDLKTSKIIYNNYVAHGRNSGQNVASKFSNKPNSYQSSLGFYKTQNTYFGKHGFSLRLRGLEPTFNNKAHDRAIVMHSVDYVSENFIKKHGRLGRSLGCPSIPKKGHKEIIANIKDGSLMFIYHPTSRYISESSFLNPITALEVIEKTSQL